MNSIVKKTKWFMLLLTAVIGHQLAYAQQESVSKGAKVYNANCARCHNPRTAHEFNEEEWSVIMPHMRHTAHLTGSESRAVEKFLAVTLTAEKAQGTVQELAHLSAQSLVTKFACNGCHQINATGGNIGPSLDGIKNRRDKDFVLHKLLEPTFNNRATAMPKFPLTEGDASRIADYLINL